MWLTALYPVVSERRKKSLLLICKQFSSALLGNPQRKNKVHLWRLSSSVVQVRLLCVWGSLQASASLPALLWRARCPPSCTGRAAPSEQPNPAAAGLPAICSRQRSHAQAGKAGSYLARRTAQLSSLPHFLTRRDAVSIPSHLLQFNTRAALQISSAFLLPAIAKRDCTEEIQASLCKTQHQQMSNQAVAAPYIWASAGPGRTPQGTLVSEHHAVGTQPRDPHTACRHPQGLFLPQRRACFTLLSPQLSPANEQFLVVHFLSVFIPVGRGLCGYPVSSAVH